MIHGFAFVGLAQEARMPVQEMNCPKCGESASEYALNKWQCLHCGSKFIYEPPPQPDQLIRQEVVVVGEESAYFVCAACGGRIPRLTCPEYTCPRCKRTVCQECINTYQGLCVPCINRRELIQNRVAVAVVLGFILMVLIWLVIVLYHLSQIAKGKQP